MLIGISGKLQSGKDFTASLMIAELLVRNKGLRLGELQIRRFADKLKDMVCILTGCTRANLEDADFKNSNMPPEWDRYIVRYINAPLKGMAASKWLATSDECEAFIMKANAHNRDNFNRYMICKESITYRMMLQEVGTDLFRDKFHPDTWVNALFSDWKQVPVESRHWQGHAISMVDEPARFPNWIIPDVRFPNEVARIKQHGGQVIRINRYPSTVLVNRAGMVVADEIPFDINNPKHRDLWEGDCLRQHPSENGLDKYDGFDAIIDNNGTLEELRSNVIDTVNKLNLKV